MAFEARWKLFENTTASSPSKSGRDSSGGSTIDAPWPTSEDGYFANTTGISGGSRPDSAACAR